MPPTATATLAPAPRYFTADFDAAAPYWRFLRSAGMESALEADWAGEVLRLTLGAGNLWAYAIYEPQTYADVRVEARADLSAAGDGAAGVLCRHSRDFGWYEFNIYADGTYALLFGEWLAEGVVRYTPLTVDESEYIGDGQNEIALVCSGDVLTGYINGHQLRSRKETQHVATDGQVGLSAAAFDTAPLVIVFDRVAVAAP